MRKRRIFVPLLLLIAFLNFDISAQVDLGPELTFYDKLKASSSAKRQADFNLKGSVKSLVEISFAENDSTFLYFNHNGLLVKRFVSLTKELIEYVYEDQQLRSIAFEDPSAKYVSKKYFNSLGYIEREVTERTIPSDTFYQESYYVFNETYDELKIHYKYKIDITMLDVVLGDFYAFTFNDKNQVIKERNLSRHAETTYGSTTTYSYDSIAGNLIRLAHLDDCALTPSCNSCENFQVWLSFDNRNNLVHKALLDNTVRNSTFTNSYGYFAKYNENNDVVEAYFTNSAYDEEDSHLSRLFAMSKERGRARDAFVGPKPIFEYEYDLKGNWVKKYESTKSAKKLVKARVIEYHAP